MSNQISVSAPGKLMLFGEHAVVYNSPCLVTAVNQRLKLKSELLDSNVFKLEAPDVGVSNYQKALKDIGLGEIPKGAKFVEFALKNFLEKYPQTKGVKFETVSDFKSTFGFGSSSASTVCTIKALCKLYKVNLSEKKIFDLCYKTVLEVQGKGSGFDLAAAIYGGTLNFIIGGKVIEPLNIEKLPIVVGYTGIKADTVTLINKVNQLKQTNPKLVSGIFNKIAQLVIEAKQALIAQDFSELGILMNYNQNLLEKLEVSSKELDLLINAAKVAGAYGAKLSGAGGGDCMIALVPENKRRSVEKAIEKSGGQVLKVEMNAKGVKIEE
jgi:mevalonate kinase